MAVVVVVNTSKICSRCETEKTIEEFYGEKRSHCIACERVAARKRMSIYGATFKGKASQALSSSRKAVKKIEQSEGITIDNTMTLMDVLLILSQDKCAYCSEAIQEKDRTVDHITPMRYGGGNTFDNCVMACRTCNSVKRDMPVLLFMLKHCDSVEVRRLFYKLSSRTGKPFGEVFEELTDHVRIFYDVKTSELLADIPEDGAI